MELSILRRFVREDAPRGDITTQAVCGKGITRGKAILLAKSELVVSGMAAIREVLKANFSRLRLREILGDGSPVRAGMIIGEVVGPVSDLLLAERLCLNVLQRMSGIATLTAVFADLAKSYGVAILDTRKTTPGLREWERRAVKDGGGQNHRLNLSDQYLIKDNHVAAAGSAAEALRRAIKHRKRTRNRALIEIEVTTVTQLAEVLPLAPDIVLLDNMAPALIRKAVALRNRINRNVLLEVSGGVSLKNIKKILPLGIERISIGALTHSAPAADISLELQ